MAGTNWASPSTTISPVTSCKVFVSKRLAAMTLGVANVQGYLYISYSYWLDSGHRFALASADQTTASGPASVATLTADANTMWAVWAILR